MEKGKSVGFSFRLVLCSRRPDSYRECRLCVTSYAAAHEVGWPPPFICFGGDRLRLATKRGLAALPNEASASRRHADAAFQPLAGEFE
ncbi:MAG: hypothetical protein RLZZ519_817 [Bacteroidota bacterium]|jgi:hypothetical protein